jgi:hypothetical protein
MWLWPFLSVVSITITILCQIGLYKGWFRVEVWGYTYKEEWVCTSKGRCETTGRLVDHYEPVGERESGKREGNRGLLIAFLAYCGIPLTFYFATRCWGRVWDGALVAGAQTLMLGAIFYLPYTLLHDRKFGE